MATKLSMLAIAWLLLAATNCSNDSDESPASGTGGKPHSDGSNSSGAVAPETLDGFCQTLAAFFCDRCDPDGGSCPSELDSDCTTNAAARDPGGYTKSKGQACLDALAQVSCDSLPLNCQANLAVAECNNYLDGQTNGVDPACP